MVVCFNPPWYEVPSSIVMEQKAWDQREAITHPPGRELLCALGLSWLLMPAG